MPIRVEHLQLQKDDPKLQRGSESVWRLLLPSHSQTLILAEHSYALLQPSMAVFGVVGTLSSSLTVMRCDATGRSAMLHPNHSCSDIAGSLPLILEHLRNGLEGLCIDALHVPVNPLLSSSHFPRAVSPLALIGHVLRQEGAPHKIKSTFRDEPKLQARVYTVEATTGALSLYSSAPQCPDFLPANASRFDQLFDLLAHLNADADAAEQRRTKLECQYDGTSPTRLPYLLPFARLILECFRSVKSQDEHNTRLGFTSLGTIDPVPFFFLQEKLGPKVENLVALDMEKLATCSASLFHLSPFCCVCGTGKGLRRCSGCKEVCLCSVEHQKQDWALHRDW
jgi:hypothetical protein